MRLGIAVVALAAMGVACVTAPTTQPTRVRLGLETLLLEDEFLDLVRGKRVGLITNQTGVDAQLRPNHLTLFEHPEINLVALFGPEHGLFGEGAAGERLGEMVEPQTGLVVHSLYGETRRPRAEWLEEIDILLYDIQDIGARGFTYIYTMAYAMEECGRHGVEFAVLDRPNPCGGDIVDGNILDPEYYSGFVGLYPIPYMYGLTPGETALMFNGEFNNPQCDLTVVPMRGWRRDMRHEDTGLPWIPSTRLITNPDTSFLTIMTGIIGEIRHLTIGVGTDYPFEVVAAPYIDAEEFTATMNAKNLPGVRFEPISFVPTRNPYEGEEVHGVRIRITDSHAIRPVEGEVHLMEVLQRLYPEERIFSEEVAGEWLFDEVWGTDTIADMIEAGATAEEVIATWQPGLADHMEMREQYLLYD
jgi:uncharacterized protein YbbC (DUF1343 family)